MSSDIESVFLGPIALISDFKLTTGSGKSLESNDHPHVITSMYKLLNATFEQNDLSTVLDHNPSRKQEDFPDRADKLLRQS